MLFPVDVRFRDVSASPAFEARARELAGKLEHFSRAILRCSIVLSRPHDRSRRGSLFEVHIRVTVPHVTLEVTRSHRRRRSHEDPLVALSDAFHALTRVVEDYERRRREARRGGESVRHPEIVG